MTVHRCSVCGSLVPPAAATCRVCGTPASTGVVDAALAEPAPVRSRAVAAVIDQLPVLLLAAAALVAVMLRVPGWWWAIAMAAAIAWTALLWWWSTASGSSPGKRWLHLSVVQDSDGGVPPALPALARLVVRGGLCLVTLGVAGLSYRWDPDGRERTWWDRICATRVTAAKDGDRRTASAAAMARWAPGAFPEPAGSMAAQGLPMAAGAPSVPDGGLRPDRARRLSGRGLIPDPARRRSGDAGSGSGPGWRGSAFRPG